MIFFFFFLFIFSALFLAVWVEDPMGLGGFIKVANGVRGGLIQNVSNAAQLIGNRAKTICQFLSLFCMRYLRGHGSQSLATNPSLAPEKFISSNTIVSMG